LKENKIISEYALSSSIPGDNTQTIIGLKKEASQPTNFIESNGGVDHNFIPFFGLALIAGDNFRENSSEDQVILTQGAMQRLGFSSPANAVGKHLFLEDGNRMTVAGIISDYKLKLVLKSHDNLFYEGNTGVVLTHVGRNDSRSYSTKLAVRLRKQGGSVEELRKVYETIFPEKALISYDLDSLINGQYYNYYSSRNQLIFFVFVTLLIAIIGLYAFVARKIATKTKEIGIRKILGASVTELSIFLLRGPIHQILVSILIAVPTAYFAIERYFEDFDQRVSFSWYHLIIPLIVFCLVTFIPIAVKIIRVAMENPTESIRYE
jgi:putative ABC transport system permease protein